tara:strand:+ start:140 stop:343 length:204 start_codon:yes stop_codon:yes gene_type:complete
MGWLDKAPCQTHTVQSRKKTMKDKINPDNDGYDQSDEYFNKKTDYTCETETETEEYFPQETSKPPHY